MVTIVVMMMWSVNPHRTVAEWRRVAPAFYSGNEARSRAGSPLPVLKKDAVRVTHRVHGNNAMPSVRSHGTWRDEAIRALPSRMPGDGAAVTETSGKG